MESSFADAACASRQAAAELTGHAAIRRAHAERGCKYAGFLPVRPGPGGKAMKLQWVFEQT